MHDTLTLLSILFGVIASGYGVRAAMTKIRNSQDDFIDDLKKQGRRASIAAVFAALSSVLIAVDHFSK
jgi:hypothetical protein